MRIRHLKTLKSYKTYIIYMAAGYYIDALKFHRKLVNSLDIIYVYLANDCSREIDDEFT